MIFSKMSSCSLLSFPIILLNSSEFFRIYFINTEKFFWSNIYILANIKETLHGEESSFYFRFDLYSLYFVLMIRSFLLRRYFLIAKLLKSLYKKIFVVKIYIKHIITLPYLLLYGITVHNTKYQIF